MLIKCCPYLLSLLNLSIFQSVMVSRQPPDWHSLKNMLNQIPHSLLLSPWRKYIWELDKIWKYSPSPTRPWAPPQCFFPPSQAPPSEHSPTRPWAAPLNVFFPPRRPLPVNTVSAPLPPQGFRILWTYLNEEKNALNHLRVLQLSTTGQILLSTKNCYVTIRYIPHKN